MSKNEVLIKEIYERIQQLEPNDGKERVDLFFACAHPKTDDSESDTSEVIIAMQGRPGRVLASAMSHNGVVSSVIQEAQKSAFLHTFKSMIEGLEEEDESATEKEGESNGE